LALRTQQTLIITNLFTALSKQKIDKIQDASTYPLKRLKVSSFQGSDLGF